MKKILYLGNQLSKHGFTPTSVETLGERLREDFDITQASSIKNQVLRLVHMWWMVINCRNYDYLLIDTYSSSAFTYAWTSARLAQLFKLKYIPILHGGDLPNRAKNSPDLIDRYIKNAHIVVSPSGYLKTAMEKEAVGNHTIIPNFIDIKNYPFEAKVPSKETGINLFWLRSFHEIYNPYLAIRLLKALAEKGFEKLSLCMVGPDKDGSMEKVKVFAEEQGVAQYLKMTGRLNKPEWIALSRQYNVFINTTNIDNTPVSVMEAMALGFPVITTKVGGIPFLFEDGKEGLMVPPDDCDALISAVLKLLANSSETKQLIYQGRKKAESWDWLMIKKLWKQKLI